MLILVVQVKQCHFHRNKEHEVEVSELLGVGCGGGVWVVRETSDGLLSSKSIVHMGEILER